MKPDFAAVMRLATQATRARDLGAATRLIQDALSGREPTGGGDGTPVPDAEARDGFNGPTLDLQADRGRPSTGAPAGVGAAVGVGVVIVADVAAAPSSPPSPPSPPPPSPPPPPPPPQQQQQQQQQQHSSSSSSGSSSSSSSSSS